MNLESYWALCVIVIVALILGMDLAKPREDMCLACAQTDKRVTTARICLVSPFLTIGIWRLICSLKVDALRWLDILTALVVAAVFTAGLIAAGRAFGYRFRDKIWVPA